MSTENHTGNLENQQQDSAESDSALTSDTETAQSKPLKAASDKGKAPDNNKVLRLLEKNPLGMTLPEMAGGPRQVKKIKMLRPMLSEAIRNGLVMPVSQRAGNTVYRLVKFLGPR
jgi:hypothetical protein